MFTLLTKGKRQAAAAFAAAAICLMFAGCGNRGRTAAPVEPDKARAALNTALDAWKSGKVPSDLQSETPKIVAQDPEWLKGNKLAAYEVLGPGEARDANLECKVKLKMVNTDGQPLERTVTFVVGTDPVLTVFRKAEM